MGAACIRNLTIYHDKRGVPAIGFGNKTFGKLPSNIGDPFTLKLNGSCLTGFYGDLYGFDFSSVGIQYKTENVKTTKIV